MLHSNAIDYRVLGGLTGHVAALSPVLTSADDEATAQATRWTMKSTGLLATAISVAGLWSDWSSGVSSHLAGAAPEGAAHAGVTKPEAGARVRALQDLFAWVDAQPPVAFVPLDAMDRERLY